MESEGRDRLKLSNTLVNIAVLGSSVVATTATAPIERMKLALQCQNEMVISGRLIRPYRGLIDCIKTTFANEGFLSFWRGNCVNILSKIASPTLGFALQVQVNKSGILMYNRDDTDVAKLTKNILRGATTGVVSMVALYSLDYCHNRLACDVLSGEKGAARQYKGMIDVYKKTLASDGVVGLYRGFVTACFGIAVYRGLYFGLYDTLRPVFISQDRTNSLSSVKMLQTVALGYFVTFTAGTISYPIDTVRRRMMMRSGEPVKYKGFVDCARQILKNEGGMSFMKGYGTNLLRGVFGAVLLGVYEFVKT